MFLDHLAQIGVATAAWTKNMYVNPWRSVNSSARTSDSDPINLRAVARRVRDNLLQPNRVEQIQTLQRETITRCLLDTRDEVLSDDGWLKEDWSD